MQQNKSQYASVPAEQPDKHPGMTEGISSMICAVIAIFFFPPIFGITGIVLGIRSKKRGGRLFGLLGIISSSICMLIGLALEYN